MFTVIDVDTGESHGDFETLEQARAAVAFDSLNDWEIWDATEFCVDRGSNP